MKKKIKQILVTRIPRPERSAPVDRALVEQDVQQRVMTTAQFKLLRGETPAYAVKQRVGRGGKNFDYVTHGYVTDQLNKAFGFDWDYRLKPVFGGNVHLLTETEEERYDEKTATNKTKKVRNIAIYGELTVRVRDSKGIVVATITKAGPGSQPWEDKTEFGDAIKGATSDGLKVAAMRLGVALDLYWDDQAEQAEFAEKSKPLPPKLDTAGRIVISVVDALRLANNELSQLLALTGAAKLSDISKDGMLTAEATTKLKPTGVSPA